MSVQVPSPQAKRVSPNSPRQPARWLIIGSPGWPARGALRKGCEIMGESYMGESYIIHTDHIGVVMLCDGAYVRKVLYDMNGDDSDARRKEYAEGLAKFLAVPTGQAGS